MSAHKHTHIVNVKIYKHRRIACLKHCFLFRIYLEIGLGLYPLYIQPIFFYFIFNFHVLHSYVLFFWNSALLNGSHIVFTLTLISNTEVSAFGICICLLYKNSRNRVAMDFKYVWIMLVFPPKELLVSLSNISVPYFINVYSCSFCAVVSRIFYWIYNSFLYKNACI